MIEKDWLGFKKHLDSWMGTPYRHACAVKGRGTDCALYIAESLRDAGFITKYEVQHYSKDWYLQSDEQVVVDHFVRGLTDHLKPQWIFDVIWASEKPTLEIGDIAVFATIRKNLANHTAVIYDNKHLMHCRPKVGVEIFPYRNSFFEKRLRVVIKINRR